MPVSESPSPGGTAMIAADPVSNYSNTEMSVPVPTHKLLQQQALEQLEDNLGLPRGYILKLGDEAEDFAFIVKLAILCEAATTTAIVAHLSKDSLYKFVSKLRNIQRLELAETFDLIDHGDYEALAAIAETRNAFAHRVSNITSDLDRYFNALDNSAKAKLLNRLFYLDASESARYTKDHSFDFRPRAIRNALFSTAMFPLISLSIAKRQAERQREKDEWLAKSMAAHVRPLSNLGLGDGFAERNRSFANMLLTTDALQYGLLGPASPPVDVRKGRTP